MNKHNNNPNVAIMTASYVNDFERCQLLCQSMDQFLSGNYEHFILVEDKDVALFDTLKTTRRHIISERDLLPSWLRPFPDPLNWSRRLWLSPYSLPLRGWHVQQLRRMALAKYISHDIIFSADSDVLFLKPFDVASLKQGNNTVFYQKPKAVTHDMKDHVSWHFHARKLLGLEEPTFPANDYVNTLIAWRRESACNVLEKIEETSGTHWVRAVISSRAISECTIYGLFVEEVEKLKHHHASSKTLCHMLWGDESMNNGEFDMQAFVSAMEKDQIAIGLQSFLNHDLSEVRKLISQ